jgi:hypothetical protein
MPEIEERRMSPVLEGGCACRSLRYRLASPPMFVQCCHCRDCQRQTGGAFVINGQIETDRIEIVSGELVATPMPTDSGRPHDVYRCAVCQTALWSDYGHRPALRFLRIATLDDPAAVRPGAHIFVRSKLPWLTIAGDIPAFDVYYDMKTLWPAESLARRSALRA